VSKTSIYIDTNTTKQTRPDIRYRSFGPFHPQENIEALWMAHVGDPEQLPAVETAVEPARKQSVENGHLCYSIRHTAHPILLHVLEPFPLVLLFFSWGRLHFSFS